ncbi:hypothetical protein [Methylocaldum sp.]|uniref:hypothetical protein n=1 Tax=Methylocaldum sp. TaxID=1969727 RepID=UPI002D281951|nr:hypothetical protein [Methylocaldum sp.]HYE36641.1 hypothetical protein [Methylocaldum sp.]
MDFSPIVNEFLKAFWWLVPLAIIIGVFKSPSGKGYFGELFARFLARLMLD